MATTTPNYGWPVPTSTDYVKDGATAIEALGDAIDATVFGLGSAGLTLINTTNFTTSSAVSIDSVFTSTYQNYKMIINYSAVSGTDAVITIVGRASGSDVTTASTWFNQQESTTSSTYSTVALNTGRISLVNTGFAERVQQVVEIQSPQLAKITSYQTQYLGYNSGGQTYSYKHIGMYNATTQMDGFKLLPSTGTISGTVRIYGYKN
jgi:hypothetical protein